ncbi:RNA polymerase sigma factor [Clostridium sp. PL3]|uniref:RNA polymerase sigma factor n=1 Tax=Clostridium thailandense TaxID=2794346 RepID=A0A949X615_9CLOT|nr:RNA polymerase sigma factor [Clostridium thailandense]MBV7276558.1 RNA polymerase sigma factor [Clostridium thailandense]
MDDEILTRQVETLYREHSEYVFRIALFLTKSKVLAEDVLQETFIKVLQKYSSYDTSKSFKPWVYSIAVNTVRNMIRKNKWHSLFGVITEVEDNHYVDEIVLQSEENKELWREVTNLSLKSREVIVLHYYLGYKLTEVAEILNIPLGTCKSRLNSALNSLKKRIAKVNFNIDDEGGRTYETN